MTDAERIKAWELEEALIILRTTEANLRRVIRERDAALAVERERVKRLVTTLDAILPAVMDALESNADIDMRRAAFESIQDIYESDHPLGSALRAARENGA